MLHIFVYEFVTAGGMWWLGEEPPAGSLLAEGRAMRDAILADFLTLDGVAVSTLVDERMPSGDGLPIGALDAFTVSGRGDHDARFASCAKQADYVLLIAPEFNGILQSLAHSIESLPRPLLGPNASFIQLASHKQATIAHLAMRQVPVPETHAVTTRDDLRKLSTARRWVMKPMKGAGSQRVSWCDLSSTTPWLNESEPWCVQEFVAGRAASVAAILAGRERALLPPMWQHLEWPSFAYQGGSRINDSNAIARAQSLAGRAFDALPPTHGYVGIDLVLGDAADGSEDRVLEVNPRLTTSYVGLRRLTADNLARTMLKAAQGTLTSLSFAAGSIRFQADGTLQETSSREQTEGR